VKKLIHMDLMNVLRIPIHLVSRVLQSAVLMTGVGMILYHLLEVQYILS